MGADGAIGERLGAFRIAMWDWDPTTDVLSYRPGWHPVHGHCENGMDAPAETELEHVHASDRDRLSALRSQLAVGERESFVLEYRIRRADGSNVWVEERSHALHETNCDSRRVSGCVVDISHRKPANHSNLLDPDRMLTLVENQPVAFCQFEGLHCIYANAYWTKMTGRDAECALGERWLESVHPEDRGTAWEYWSERQQGPAGEEVSCNAPEGRFVRPDGSVLWFASTLRCIYDHLGQLESATVILMEVCERKELEQWQTRFKEILETTTDFVGIATPDRKILWQNKKLNELRPDLSDPSRESDFAEAHPQWSREIMRDIAVPHAMEHGCWQGEMAIYDIDQNEIPVSQVLIAHRGTDGSLEAISTIMRNIRPTKDVEQELRASERRYASLAEKAPVAIFRFGDGDNCIYVNEQWSKQTGRPREEALGTGWKKSVHPDDLEQARETTERFVNDPEQLVREPYEARHVLSDGTTKWVQVHVAKEQDDDGNVTGLVGILSDIDASKRTEQELRELNDRLHKVLECSSIGIWEWCWEDQRLEWDEQMFVIYGAEPANFGGTYEEWSDRVHPDDLGRLTSDRPMGMPGQGVAEEEFRIVRPNGETRYIYSKVYHEFDVQGCPHRTTGIDLDITDLRRTELALAESENKFARIEDNVPGMLYRTVVHPNRPEELVYVNSRSADIYECDAQDALKDAQILLNRIHPDDRVPLKQKIEASTADLEPLNCEYRLQLPQKGTRWVQSFAKPTRESDGRVVWDGIVIDVTDQKRAEQQLHVTNEELRKATRLKDEFLANMSHELRTPLSAILGMTEGLRDGVFGSVTENQLGSLRVIQESGSHLLALINDVLDLAKIESGSVELNIERFGVEDACTSAIHFVSQDASKQEVQLRCTIQEDLPPMEADERRLRQILINLLSNAVKFTPRGGSVRLDVRLVKPSGSKTCDMVCFAVEDTGIGIEASKQESLFDPFYQIDSSLSRDYEGTGLGLALVKQFTDLHSGSVSVESRPGLGSLFQVLLPLTQQADAMVAKACTAPEIATAAATASEQASSTRTVMLVEDNELVATTTRQYLQASGFEVQLVANGHEAMDAVESQQPDIILMDVQMPGVSGLDVIGHLRTLPQHASTPVIALTGLAMQDDENRCLAAGANVYMSKPYRMAELIDTIGRLLASE